jgi:4a-hydroxytetrahydrobiopterin dehydratase
MAVCSDEDRAEALRALPGWGYDADARAIRRSLRFRDFPEAFAFMTRVALEAEKADHHPDWSNVWNRVDIALSTHSEGGVTPRDFALASRIDAISAQLALPAGDH